MNNSFTKKLLIALVTTIGLYANIFAAISSQNVSQLIQSGDIITSGEVMEFPAQNLFLTLQSDGNLVMYKGTPSAHEGAVWATGTAYEQNDYYATLQGDGNMVIYRGVPGASQGAIYASHSVNGNGDYFLGIDADGRLCIFKGVLSNIEKIVWSNIKYSMSGGEKLLEGEMFKTPGRNAFLILQGDGNFVLYQGSGRDDIQGVLWATGTSSDQDDHFVNFQSDGNFVVYTGTPLQVGTAIYASQVMYDSYHMEISADLKLTAQSGPVGYPGNTIWENGFAKAPSVLYSAITGYTDSYQNTILRYFNGETSMDIPGSESATEYALHDGVSTYSGSDDRGRKRLRAFNEDGFNGQVDNPNETFNVATGHYFEGIYYYATTWGSDTTFRSFDGSQHRIIHQYEDRRGTFVHSGHKFAWIQASEVYYYNGQNVIRLTDNSYEDTAVKIDGDRIVWVGNGNIFLFDGNSNQQLTFNGIAEEPVVSQDLVAWKEGDVIFTYQNGSVSQVPFTGNAINLDVFGMKVVWAGGSSYKDIFLYENGSVVNVTDSNLVDDSFPEIRGNWLVWDEHGKASVLNLKTDESFTIDADDLDFNGLEVEK